MDIIVPVINELMGLFGGRRTGLASAGPYRLRQPLRNRS
jgi:hypothetical protein